MPTNWITQKNGHIPRNTQTTKTESQINEKSEGNFNFKETELAIKNLPTNKRFSKEFSQTFKEKPTAVLLQLFSKIEENTSKLLL